MTFYSIISGILFLGACKAFLAVLGSWTMLPTALLALTIINEAVITSELIERAEHPVPYSLGMKLLDFVTFVVLAWALLVVSPARNAFDIDVSAALPGASSPRVFWLLLMVYWLLVFCWNHVAGQFTSDRWRPWFKKWMRCMAIAPAAGLAVDWRAADFHSASVVVVAANLAILASYLAGKLVATRKQVATDAGAKPAA